jgi:hypothetical protein
MDGTTQDANNDMETNLDQVCLSSLEKIPWKNHMRNGFCCLYSWRKAKYGYVYIYIHTYIYIEFVQFTKNLAHVGFGKCVWPCIKMGVEAIGGDLQRLFNLHLALTMEFCIVVP